MDRRRSLLALLASLGATFWFLWAAPSAFATGDGTVLYSFNGHDGAYPAGPLVFDSAGNLYGTCYYGGTDGNGTVFKLSPGPGHVWTASIYSFPGVDGLLGAHPYAGLILDSAGNLYGTASWGGDWGYGAVFKMTVDDAGNWTETVLYSFGGLEDGANPSSSLVFDSAGNLYGTTMYGGDSRGVLGGGYGAVFKLSPTESGHWVEKVLYTFHNTDGANPKAGVVFDSAGNLYGGTVGGGYPLCNITCGVVYELTPASNGTWTENVLHIFELTDGGYNEGGVALDAAGNLHGTTLIGGRYGNGTVFELSPAADGEWGEKVYSLNGTVSFLTYAGPLLDAAGNTYVASSGSNSGAYLYGSVFELKLESNGGWADDVLHFFDLEDGANPIGSLIFDASGNLYGTAPYGGHGGCTGDGCGAVYEIEVSP